MCIRDRRDDSGVFLALRAQPYPLGLCAAVADLVVAATSRGSAVGPASGEPRAAAPGPDAG
eukprot:5254925-Alexandrium_andersonii.AAC.1